MRNRTLSVIEEEIRIALKRKTDDVITLGGLLKEAKAQLKHGEWLPWLEKKFSLSETTARRYVKAHEFARSKIAKSANLEHLKLHVSALYLLCEGQLARRTTGSRLKRVDFAPEVIEAVLEEAKDKWVGPERIQQILTEFEDAKAERQPAGPEPKPKPELKAEPGPKPGPKPGPEPEQPEPEAKRDQPEPEALLEGKPQSEQFATSVRLLKRLMTKPIARFVGVAPADDLETVAMFLRQVAGAMKKARAA
jgi:Protein of unknown function (DUF3102)